MNSIQIFFKTRIKHTGFLSAIGDFFLAPARFIFSGKTVVIERDGNSNLSKKDASIAKVSSFFIYNVAEDDPLYHKFSKQSPNLKSTGWLGMPFIPLIQLALLIPGAIIGSIFKGLSYFSPIARKAHNIVQKKLTA